MSFMSCCVLNCFVRHGDGVPLHLFPNPITDQERFQAWVRKIGGEVATLEQSFVFKNRRICHKHFDPIYYASKNRLSKIALPSISIPDINVQPPLNTHTSASHLLESDVPGDSDSNCNKVLVETIIASTSNDCGVPVNTVVVPMGVTPVNVTLPRRSVSMTDTMTPNELKLREIITNLKKQVRRNKVANKLYRQRLNLANKNAKQVAIRYMNKNMTKAARIFVKMLLKQAGKKAKGRRFTLKEKVLSLSLYKSCPKAYHLFSDFLPKRITLLKLLQKVKLQPGINNHMLKDLKKNVDKLPLHHRYCTLIFDEMSIAPKEIDHLSMDFGFTFYIFVHL